MNRTYYSIDGKPKAQKRHRTNRGLSGMGNGLDTVFGRPF